MKEALQNIIKEGTCFPKLEKRNECYAFSNWSDDGNHFRYIVEHNGGLTRKRVLVEELKSLLNNYLVAGGKIDRRRFNAFCPVTYSDGYCAYAVFAEVVRLLKIGEYAGRKRGILINDTVQLRALLARGSGK